MDVIDIIPSINKTTISITLSAEERVPWTGGHVLLTYIHGIQSDP